jgi:hypothetical protein
MPPDLISASVNWKVPQNGLPKMPQDAFSVGVRYHVLRSPAAISGTKPVRRMGESCSVREVR